MLSGQNEISASEGGRKLVLATPRGFCAGVVRAIDIVNLALRTYGQPLYVRREIVHNSFVVSELRARGVIFVDELDEIPAGARVIFSAHGVSPDVRRTAAERGLKVIDASCPLVIKVHREAVRYAQQGCTIILIGHTDHDEVVITTVTTASSLTSAWTQAAALKAAMMPVTPTIILFPCRPAIFNLTAGLQKTKQPTTR